MSFDLAVWAMGPGATPDDVRAANDLCVRRRHLYGRTDARVTAFHTALTAGHPERAGAGCPWAELPLHLATDHVRMRLDENCPDEVLETIERLPASTT